MGTRTFRDSDARPPLRGRRGEWRTVAFVDDDDPGRFLVKNRVAGTA